MEKMLLEVFPPLPMLSQKAIFFGVLINWIVWWSVNPFPNKPWFFMCLQYMSLENTVEKGEIASNFSLFQRVFYPFGDLSAIFIQFTIAVGNLFQFGTV